MTIISVKSKQFLEDLFGNRANFNPVERKLYSHDIAAMPSLVKPLVGKTTPEAVVQPETEEELKELLKWAARKRIPVTPRAKGSSGYGGVIPVKKGIVIDFYRMNKLLSLDKKAMTVRVQAGIVWEKLDKHIKKLGFTIRTYPTSYPASTVGGWLAQGGAGIGSYEAGWFRENVISAKVIFPDGSAKEMKGKDLDLISEAEGITGLITEVTVKVMKDEELELLSIGCPNAHDLQKLIQRISDNNLPVWSLIFINPKMAELKNKAPLLEHYGHPVEERILLPAAYIMTLAYRKKDKKEFDSKLPSILKLCEAEILSDKIAHHEWDNRFKLMVVKRLGPSLVPMEVVIPLETLGNVMMEIEKKVDQPIVKEGVVIHRGLNGKPEVVILGFIPSSALSSR
jgi:FAD/FMN-containing dehydrogenase